MKGSHGFFVFIYLSLCLLEVQFTKYMSQIFRQLQRLLQNTDIIVAKGEAIKKVLQVI